MLSTLYFFSTGALSLFGACPLLPLSSFFMPPETWPVMGALLVVTLWAKRRLAVSLHCGLLQPPEPPGQVFRRIRRCEISHNIGFSQFDLSINVAVFGVLHEHFVVDPFGKAIFGLSRLRDRVNGLVLFDGVIFIFHRHAIFSFR